MSYASTVPAQTARRKDDPGTLRNQLEDCRGDVIAAAKLGLGLIVVRVAEMCEASQLTTHQMVQIGLAYEQILNAVDAVGYLRTYEAYLRSPEWAERRKVALEADGYRCRICNTNQGTLQVHHRTYERLGQELAADLITLCLDCHRLFHANGKLVKVTAPEVTS